jgi:hypothetical protein
MSGELWAALEATALAQALRASVWVYPLVNAAHLLGVALLLGAIIPLDLRLLGVWRALPLAPLWQVLTRSAGAGLVLAAVFGAILFTTHATEYAVSGLFVAKMGVVAIGLANALALRRIVPDAQGPKLSAAGQLPPPIRLAAGLSLASWITALTLGRLVGYF